MPGAPPLRSTRSSAAIRFWRSQILSHSSALAFPSLRAGDCSTLCSSPAGFTCFACPVVPLSGAFGLPRSSHDLCKVLVLSRCSALPTSTAVVLWPRLTPAASAWPLDQGYLSAQRQVSPGKNVDFPCTLAGFTALALDCLGLRCHLPTRPTARPPIRFVFLKSQVCLRLPPDPTSR